jgi:deoxyribodipyrimidine photo-lyase
MAAPALFWFRRDLRLADNPGLAAAAAGGRPIIPVFIHDPAHDRRGGALDWWLHHSLEALDTSLRKLGSRLIVRQGDAAALIPKLAEETGAEAVYCNRLEEPWAVAQQERIDAMLRAGGRAMVIGNAALLFELGSVTNGSGQPFRVFTPFWKACLREHPPASPLDAPESLPPVDDGLLSDRLDLLPTKPDWAGGLRAAWTPGEDHARAVLDRFIADRLVGYAGHRDVPGEDATSALSPYLRFGEIGPRQVFHAIRNAAPPSHDADRFLAELGWREFSYHLLASFPDLPNRPLRGEFARFPWRDDPAAEAAWQKGQTGIPLVDAGMRQLWTTGWMHNRVRMIVASFLVKNLLIPWQKGEAWFWDTLVDADLANNSASWQWVAGCGADAAPYFRIFNPVLQGEKFDPKGAYVRRWCPELARIPDRFIHTPWEAGRPKPIVDLAASRTRALEALATISKEQHPVANERSSVTRRFI